MRLELDPILNKFVISGVEPEKIEHEEDDVDSLKKAFDIRIKERKMSIKTRIIFICVVKIFQFRIGFFLCSEFLSLFCSSFGDSL